MSLAKRYPAEGSVVQKNVLSSSQGASRRVRYLMNYGGILAGSCRYLPIERATEYVREGIAEYAPTRTRVYDKMQRPETTK